MNHHKAKTTIFFNRLHLDLGDWGMMIIFDTFLLSIKGFFGYFTLLMSDKVRVRLISFFNVDFHKT